MTDIVSTIENLKNKVSTGPVSAVEVSAAEKKLALTFAKDYTAYLQKYGVVSAYHVAITGITSAKRLNVVDVTLVARQKHTISSDMYVVDDTGIEGILVLQNREGDIFELQNNKTKKIYDNLSDYLLSL
jgi:hypothetical protein